MNWTVIAALAASVAAIAAVASVIAIWGQIRSERKLTRYTVGIETLLRLQETWDRIEKVRSKAATELQNKNCGSNVVRVLDFFDTVAKLTKSGVIDEDLVWHTFYWPMANYWAACQDHIRKIQADEGEATWVDFSEVMAKMRAQESKESRRNLASIGPSSDQVREFMSDEKRQA